MVWFCIRFKKYFKEGHTDGIITEVKKEPEKCHGEQEFSKKIGVDGYLREQGRQLVLRFAWEDAIRHLDDNGFDLLQCTGTWLRGSRMEIHFNLRIL